jgi:cell division protein FtsW (lipid II flippase)
VILAAAAGTPLKVSLAATAASLLLLIVVFELIRSRRLRERYALLWLLTGLVLLALSAWRGGLNTIAGWVGVQTYPPAVLFAVAVLFVLAVLLHYSTVISKLSDENVILAQRLALLEFSVSENVGVSENLGVSEKLSARDDRREPGPAAATAPAERER